MQDRHYDVLPNLGFCPELPILLQAVRDGASLPCNTQNVYHLPFLFSGAKQIIWNPRYHRTVISAP